MIFDNGEEEFVRFGFDIAIVPENGSYLVAQATFLHSLAWAVKEDKGEWVNHKIHYFAPKETVSLKELQESMNPELEPKIQGFIIKRNFGYIVGSRGYTLINFVGGSPVTSQSTDIREWSVEERKIFRRIENRLKTQ